VVLVDHGTASSSEIVTAALQDQHRAEVVGTATYGKGVFQNTLQLVNGGALDITIGQFFTPTGRNLGDGMHQGTGITPTSTRRTPPATQPGEYSRPPQSRSHPGARGQRDRDPGRRVLLRPHLSFPQVCVLADESAVGSLRASARLTRRRWWRTFGFTALIDGIAILSGPLLGVLILLLTSRSLTFIDITGSIVYALVVPWAAIALTLYYFDLQERGRLPSR
jgi:hypothetical protein